MITLENTYASLPERFHSKVSPEKLPELVPIALNKELAQELFGKKIETYSDSQLSALFSGQEVIPNSEPIALAYAGHQFGHFSAALGDGRALLLGEAVSTTDNKRYDIQLKGSGRTPYSRNGDGKSSLGPVIREYLVSEAMFHLGIPTTRSLAAFSSGEYVFREDRLPGGPFTRVASSHVRIGTFEFFASRGDLEAVKILADYSIERHYPSAKTFENPYLQFLKCVAEAQSSLVAQWMAVGFIHGVMNTDNMAISGETLDFGPCAFMDNFAFDRVYSSIDRHGRYSYNNQIPIAIWNLYRLAECLIPLLDSEPQKGQAVAQNFLEEIKEIYQQNWLDKMRPKLGLQSTEPEDESLINQWLQYLEIEDLDFTLSFRNLDPTSASSSESQLFKSFHQKWLVRLQQQSIPLDQIKNAMNNVNPLFIPRNHQVEKAIQGALVQDYSIFEELKQVLKNPYGDQDRFKQYQTPPLPNERIAATFCGT